MTRIKAIIINGYSRGGTNVLWNMLQSHPHICSPIYETGELFFDHIFPFHLLEASKAKKIASLPITAKIGKRYLRRQFDLMKLKNLTNENNNTKCDGVKYSRREIEESVICFKGVDSDVELNGLLESIYDDVAHIVLVRNGYAVCNGWKRRGVHPREAGRKYRSLYNKMIASKERAKNFTLIKFEDILQRPFDVANGMFRDLELDPIKLPKLRLKAKLVLKNPGTHETVFGVEGKKYWLGPDEISKALDPGVNIRQIEQLKESDRVDFELGAKETLKELGYLKHEEIVASNQRSS
jgi:hypothetical protein